MKTIGVFYHCLFCHNNRVAGGPVEVRENAVSIIRNQMARLAGYGLYDASSDIIIGVNGGDESREIALSSLPAKAKVIFHGTEAKSETPTVVLAQAWAKEHPDCYLMYFHSKGATHVDVAYLKFVERWRNCMMRNLVDNWGKCISDLDSGFDSVGCHWMTNMSPPSDKDSIWGGNFWWAKTDFLNTLPSIMDRELIRQHGIYAPIARYESERFLGAGPRLPKVKDYHINGIGSCT